jgi:hypothetical protein
MMSTTASRSHPGHTTAALSILITIIILPLLVIQVIPTDNPQPYIFRATIVEKLGETLNGKLQYFLVEHIEGNAPSETFVAAVDRAYSRGHARVNVSEGNELWMQGNLMTREIYFAEHYLFFNQPQVYVGQIKDSGFWPDQLTELQVLYFSPISTLSSPIFALLFPFVEEYSLRNFIILVAKTALVIITLFLLAKNRFEKQKIVFSILVYALLAIILTVPILTDLY